MKHKRDSSGRATAVMLAIGSALLAACGEGDAGTETVASRSDPELFTYCSESRGALLEFEWMVGGSRPVNTSTVEHGAGFMGRLADRVAAAEDVRNQIRRLDTARTTWLDQLRAMPPRFENGQLIEPDTLELDRALIGELKALGKPLADWVNKTCEGVRL